MATAVTLKESDGTEIYPVTDISLVNNGIHAVDIEATTPVPAVETAMIADGAVTSAKIADGTIATGDIADSAVTSAKIDWSTVTATSVSASDFITAEAGYTISSSNLYKTGNLLVGTIVIEKGSGYFESGQVKVGTIKSGYKPKAAANYFAGLGNNTYAILGACYFFAGAGGDMFVNNTTGIQNCAYVKAQIMWFVS